jgi:hypothetical protein
VGEIRITSPPWNPTRIGGCKLWLRSTSISGVADGGQVATWSDESGLGNDFTQSTASKRPLLYSNQVKGRPAVRFDGEDDFLTAGDILDLETAKTVVLCVKAPFDANQVFMGKQPTAGGAGWRLDHISSDGFLRFIGATSVDGTSPFVQHDFGSFDSNFHILGFAWKADDATSIIFYDGDNQAVFTDTSAHDTAPAEDLQLGSIRSDGIGGIAMDVAELVMYDHMLASGDLTTINNDWALRYGISI